MDDKGPDSPALKAMLCGSSPKEPAWIKVHRNGVLNFHNDHGDEGNCTVDASLNKGSLCTISNSVETSAPSSKSQLSPSDASSSHVSAVAAAPTVSSDSSGTSDPSTDCWMRIQICGSVSISVRYCFCSLKLRVTCCLRMYVFMRIVLYCFAHFWQVVNDLSIVSCNANAVHNKEIKSNLHS